MALGAVAVMVAALVFSHFAGPSLRQGVLFDFDLARAAWWHGHQAPGSTFAMQTLSALHGTGGILVLTAIACALLASRQSTEWALRMALVVPGGMLLNVAVKNIVGRARPTFDGLPPSLASFSFPSGHTAEATVFYGLLVATVFAVRRDAATRIAAIVLAMALIVAVALSRLYLGAHYVSDVVAAVIEGVGWLVICLGNPTRRTP